MAGNDPIESSVYALPLGMRLALEAIRMAPSAHNTQPWRIVATGPERLRVEEDTSRGLSISDPEGEQVAYSLGCAIEAACELGGIEHIVPEKDPPSGAIRSAGELILHRLDLDRAEQTLHWLSGRRSHRGSFLRMPPPRQVLRAIEVEAERGRVAISIVSDRDAIGSVARLSTEGASAVLSDDAFLSELLDWIRFPREGGDPIEDGFTPATLRLDPVAAFLVRLLIRSPRARRIAARLGLARIMGWQTGAAVRRSGALVLLAANRRGFADRIEIGRTLMRVWLAAHRAGLVAQLVHFPLTLEPMRSETMRIFGLESSLHPATLIRLGYASQPAAPSCRRSRESMLVIEDEELVR